MDTLRCCTVIQLVIVLGLGIIVSPVIGQEPPVTQTEQDHDASESAEAADEESAASRWQNMDQILQRDIQTAGYYELLEIARQENISTSGTAVQLRARLYSHFGLAAPQKPEDSEQGVRIRVDSAQETRFFTEPERGDDMFQLSGGVVLYLDDEDGRRHRVQADQVIFNQTQDLITAQGNVLYSLDRGTDTEEYRGETLTFRLEDWSGAFAQGTTTRERTIDDQQLPFSYTGEFITRSGVDVVVLDQGTITSSEADPPNYRIKADKIWIFAPGEWGLRHAVLYVGRVPLFYFPFYFNQGRDFFFSPALAQFPVQGQAVFTTTYLYGHGEEGDSPVSVLQLADEPDRTGRRAIDGLYYSDEDVAEDDSDAPERTLRIMADLYSNLGSFLAVDGNYSELWRFRNIDFFAGIGRTREIYTIDGSYTPWFPDGDELESVWHEPYFLGARFPFRYGFRYSGRLSLPRMNLNTRWEMHSDRYFRQDQSRRSENFQVLQIVTNPDPPEASQNQVNRYNWQLQSNINLPTAAPYINRFSISQLETRLDWQSQNIADERLDPRSTDSQLAGASPAKEFFVPRLIVLPRMRIAIAGNLVDTRRGAAIRDTEQFTGELNQGQGLFPLELPWPTENNDDPTGVDTGLFELPALRSSISQPAYIAPLRYSLSYSVSPIDADIEALNLVSDISHPDEIELNPRFWEGRLRVPVEFTQKLDVFNDYGIIQSTVRSDARYRQLWDKAEEFDWDNEKRNAIMNSHIKVTTFNSASVYPLRAVPDLGGSNLTYSFNTLYGEYSVDESVEDVLEDTRFKWESDPFNEDSIAQHSIKSELKYSLFTRTQVLSAERYLPPLLPRTTYGLGLNYGYGWYSGSQAWKLMYDEDEEYEWSPVRFSNRLERSSRWFINQTGEYDIEEDQLTSLILNARTGYVSGRLQYSYTRPYTLSQDPLAWVREEDEVFILESGSIQTNSLQYAPDPFWKNRLRLTGNVSSTVTLDFQRFTQSRMSFDVSATIDLHEIFRLEFSSKSANEVLYAYFPTYAKQVGIDHRSPVEDIVNGFRFWDSDRRRESNFNISDLRVKAIYRMGDWDLNAEYSAKPVLGDDLLAWKWENRLAIELVWKPISELSTEVTIDDDGITY